MEKTKRQWKLRVIHFSHTDLGYKDLPSKVINQQNQNLKQVITKLNATTDLAKWKWNIECFGTLTTFLQAYPEWENKLVKLIKEKRIGVSGNYWNFTKIISAEVLASKFEEVNKFKAKHQLNINSLMTNDVNGYAQSWAELAANTGIDNFYFGLHTHHGMYPAFKKQAPFWWKLPSGKKVFVWIGEQYAFGNNLGLVPGPISDYLAQDNLSANHQESKQLALANQRIEIYCAKLLKDHYPFEIVPLTVLGTGADNDPANFKITKRIEILAKGWKKYGVAEIKMVTLDQFFAEIHRQKIDLPIYQGAWPDWWANGVGAHPQALRAFKIAQRHYKYLLRVDPKLNLNQLANNLLLFAEHTFGSEDSLQDAHSEHNFTIEKLKNDSAYQALKLSHQLINQVNNWIAYLAKQEEIISFEVTNPFDMSITKTVELTSFLGFAEKNKLLNCNLMITSNDLMVPFNIEIVPHPQVKAWGKKKLLVHLTLKANETKKITLKLGADLKAKQAIASFAALPADRVADLINHKKINRSSWYTNNLLNTKHYKITFDQNGIKQIYDKYLQTNLLLSNKINLLAPTYFASPTNFNRDLLFLERQKMGRNRISENSQKFQGILKNKKIKITKEQNVKIFLYYQLPQTSFYEVQLTLYHHNSQIIAEINLNHHANWAVESLFAALPFKGIKHLEYDYPYQPGIEQIPGTLIDYHTIQEGMQIGNVVISQLDNSLVWIGDFNFGFRSLAKGKINNHQPLYSWLLNNNWETNFSIDTSGFHSFRFVFEPTKDLVFNLSEKVLGNASDFKIRRL